MMQTVTYAQGPDPFEPVTSNDDWTPVEQEFEDVTMVLVPAGCFMMGSTDAHIEYTVNELGDSPDWIKHEQPAHQVCFDTPYWMDKTEVTRALYANCEADDACTWMGSSPYSVRDFQPINLATWFQAQDYCAWRNARLPTEAEWEYAARGPDSLVFPWGNEFEAAYVVYESNSIEAANVGSRPEGASWAGALDMSGNVWEWTSTIYDQEDFPYPYDDSDGREDLEEKDSRRVVRGGSFFVTSNFVRAAYRSWSDPNIQDLSTGFRCVRDFEG